MGKLTLKLTEKNRRILAGAMMALAGVMAIDGVYQAGMYWRWNAWIPDVQAAATQPTDTQAAESDQKKTDGKIELSEAIKKRNIFTKPPDKGHHLQLTGVLGKTALFKNRGGQVVGIEEGKSGHGIKVKSIDGYTVVIEYEGKDETMRLFKDERPASPPPAPSVEAPKAKKAEQTAAGEVQKEAKAESVKLKAADRAAAMRERTLRERGARSGPTTSRASQ